MSDASCMQIKAMTMVNARTFSTSEYNFTLTLALHHLPFYNTCLASKLQYDIRIIDQYLIKYDFLWIDAVTSI